MAALGTTDGSVRIGTSFDTSDFDAGIKKMMGAVGKLGVAIGIAFSVATIINFGKKAVETAAATEAALAGLASVVDATGRSFAQAEGFIKSYTEDGLVSATAATEAYKNMLLRGYDTSQIEQMMQIMKDAAVYNRQAGFTMDEAITRTAQGLRMENSLLTDSAGIQKNVAKMWQEYAKSIGTTANNLTDAQKRQAEFNGFVAEGGIYAGSAAKYMDTYGGRLAQLSASFLNLRVAVGNSIIPVISRVLPYIKAAVDALTRWFNRIALIMSMLFGVDISTQAQNAQNAMSGMAQATNAAADAQQNLADSTANAGKAAKGALASFDDLNVLQQKDEGGGSGAGPVAGLEALSGGGLPETLSTPALDTSETDAGLEALRQKIESFKASVKEFFEPFKEPLAALGESYRRLGEAIKNALFPEKEEGEEDSVTLKILTAFRDGIIGIIEGITWLNNKIAEFAEKNPERFRDILILLGLILIVVLAFANPILGIIAVIVILTIIIGVLRQHWDELKEAAKEWWEGFKEYWSGFGAVIAQIAKDVWIWIKGLWHKISTLWFRAPEWFREKVIDPIKKAFKTAGDWIKEKFGAALNGIKGIAANVVNWVIRMLNKIQINIPDWVPGLGGKKWGVNIQEVSWGGEGYATGGVIEPNQPRLVMVGDHRTQRELIAPEDMIRRIVREETAQNQLNRDPGIIDNRIVINGREVFREMKRIERQQGGSLLSGAGI